VSDPLSDLIRRGEGQTVEFKRSLGQRDRALEALCGMLNTNGGEATVLFGVEPDGDVRGIDPGNIDSHQRSLSRSIQNNIEPTLRPELQIAELEGKKILALHATRPRDVPLYEFRGRAFIRIGSETLRMSLSEREALVKRRRRAAHPGPWKCDGCGSVVGKLAGFAITAEGIAEDFDCPCGGEFSPV